MANNNNNNVMEDELEEGELHSEEEGSKSNDEFSVDYEVLPRPVKVGGGLDAGSSRTMGMGIHPPVQAAVSSSAKHPALEEKYEEDDPLFDDKSSSSSDSSDAEGGPSGRKCRRMPNTHFASFVPNESVVAGPAEGAMDASTDNNDAFNSHAADFQKKRQPNTVWSSVLQEEEAADILGKVNVEEYDDNHVLVERGPETFSVKYAVRPPAHVRSDSSSLSSGGLTDGEYDCLCGGFSRRGDDEDGMGEEIDVDGGEFVEQFGKRPAKRKYSNSKLRRQKNKRKSKLVNRMRRMNLLELGHYMAEKLQEPKHNLIVNAIEMLGKDPMIKLFLKTTKIERRGGLMIKNQERRRTPGGVFFYLLRGDPRYPRNTVNRIFAADSKNQIAGRKRASNEARKQKLKTLREKQKEHGLNTIDERTPMTVTDVPVKPTSEITEGPGSDGDIESEADIDSDEYCGTHDSAPPVQGSFAFDTRDAVSYDDPDCLDIDCDASDLA